MTDPNVCGQAYALMVWTPVVPGREQGLRDALAALPTGGQSPLARLGGTHFARWLVLDDLPYQGPPQTVEHLRNAWLVFVSNHDGGGETYLRRMAELMPAEADAVWSHCVGYPGSADPGSFAAYLQHNRIDTTFFVSAYPDATVPDVRESLDLRAGLLDFACAAESLDDAELQRRFLARFGAGAR